MLAMVHLGQIVPGLDTASRILTEVGGYRFLLPLIVAAAIWLLVRRRVHQAVAFVAITVGGRLIVEATKAVVARPRPGLSPHQVDVTSMSFPSGHAANAMIMFLALALVAAPKRSRTLVAIALIAAAAVGLTRPILAVHWPSDVVGGWLIGLVWTLGCVWLYDRWMMGRPLATNGRPVAP